MIIYSSFILNQTVNIRWRQFFASLYQILFCFVLARIFRTLKSCELLPIFHAFPFLFFLYTNIFLVWKKKKKKKNVSPRTWRQLEKIPLADSIFCSLLESIDGCVNVIGLEVYVRVMGRKNIDVIGIEEQIECSLDDRE